MPVEDNAQQQRQTAYDWKLYPQAEKYANSLVQQFLKHSPAARSMAKRMQSETSTTLFDWIDHIAIPEMDIDDEKMEAMNFHQSDTEDVDTWKNHDSVIFPITAGDHELAIKVEDMGNFSSKFNVTIEGSKFSPLRRAIINQKDGWTFSAMERRGSDNFYVIDDDESDIGDYRTSLAVFARRKRKFSTDSEGMDYTRKLIEDQLRNLSSGRVADSFFRCERAYWQSRNKAGQIQKKRQDRLGLGWGNHDHHTYRSSRENFGGLVKIFEAMGYECREQFYAGEGAGWGAQIFDHPDCEIVIFADVDITKDERMIDFAHEGLKQSKKFGTVGLWIALHGESILQAGMHHLEARFDFEKLRKDLQRQKVGVMKPFSYFDFLKQAFTEGEVWDVEKKRVDALLKSGSISQEQHDKFVEEGAIGSHMENLQRRQGYKGFNQDSVSAIIKATDPRLQHHKDYHKHRGA